MDRQRERQEGGQIDSQSGRQTDRQMYRQEDTWAGSQEGRQACRQAGRQEVRHTVTQTPLKLGLVDTGRKADRQGDWQAG